MMFSQHDAIGTFLIPSDYNVPNVDFIPWGIYVFTNPSMVTCMFSWKLTVFFGLIIKYYVEPDIVSYY